MNSLNLRARRLHPLGLIALLGLITSAQAVAMSRTGQNNTITDLQNSVRILHNAGLAHDHAMAVKGMGLRFQAIRCLQQAFGQETGSTMVHNTEFKMFTTLGSSHYEAGISLLGNADLPAMKRIVDRPCRP